MVDDIFLCFFYVSIVNLLPIIYFLLQCSFDLLCAIALALAVTLSLYTYLCIFHCDEKPNAWTLWLEAVAWTRRHCHYFLLLVFFLLLLLLPFLVYFSILPAKYFTYLSGFHCPVDSVFLRTTLIQCINVYPMLNVGHSSIIGYNIEAIMGLTFEGLVYFL